MAVAERTDDDDDDGAVEVKLGDQCAVLFSLDRQYVLV